MAAATTEVLRTTVSDDLAAQYSWSGLKGKRSLEELEFTKLVCGWLSHDIVQVQVFHQRVPIFGIRLYSLKVE